MSTETTVTTTENGGEATEEQKSAAQAAEAAASGTATETEAGGELTDEQKAAAAEAAKAEEARKAEEDRKSKAQDKINRKINLAKAEAAKEREARQKAEIDKARAEGELEAYRKIGTKPGESQLDPNAEPVEPDYDQLETVADIQAAQRKYLKEYASWSAKQVQVQVDKKLEAIRGTVIPAETPEQKRVRETQEKIDTTLQNLHTEFGDDTVETITSMSQKEFSDSMRDIILNKPENSTKLLKAIADNPELGKKIAAMPVFDQVREIDKLEVAILTKRSTSAPAPVSTVAGKGGGQVDPSKMSDEEWFAWRKKQKFNSA